MKTALGLQAVLPEKVAMVRRKDDDRVVGDPQFVQLIENTPDVFIHHADHAVIDGDQLFLVKVRQPRSAAVFVIMMRPATVDAVPRFLQIGKVGMFFLRFCKMRRIAVVFARHHFRNRKLIRVVHRIPRLGYEVFGMRVEEAGPQEKALVIFVILFQ